MTERINIYTLFDEVVRLTGNEVNKDILFLYGPAIEILEQLIQIGSTAKTDAEKYPVICLVGNSPIEHGDYSCYGEGTFNFVIAYPTLQEWTASKRMSEIYEPYLLPIKDAFLHQLWQSTCFDIESPEAMQFTETINFDYAKNTVSAGEVQLSEIIDAIELTNFKIKIKQIQ